LPKTEKSLIIYLLVRACTSLHTRLGGKKRLSWVDSLFFLCYYGYYDTIIESADNVKADRLVHKPVFDKRMNIFLVTANRFDNYRSTKKPTENKVTPFASLYSQVITALRKII